MRGMRAGPKYPRSQRITRTMMMISSTLPPASQLERRVDSSSPETPRFLLYCDSEHARCGFKHGSLCRGRIDHRRDFGDPICREASLPRMLPHHVLVRCDVNAVDLI